MKNPFLFLMIFLAFLLLIIFLYSRFIGTRGLYVKEYTISNQQLPIHFHGLKIIHLSDLHFGDFINEEKMKKIIEKVNLINPDIIVFTGDLIENDLNKNEKEILTNSLKELDARLGKYAVGGNHDLEYDYWQDIIEDGGFQNIEEKTALIYDQAKKPILIYGLSPNLNNDQTPQQKLANFNKSLEENPDLKNTYKILLMHEPDFVDDFDFQNFNLILAGHSHRGQIRLPFLGPLLLPKGATKYYDEFYQLEKTKLYISSGIGNSQVNLRLFNRPSFNFYRIIN